MLITGGLCNGRNMDVFGAEEYKYGTYRFVTSAEKNRVNDLAMQIRKERGCETYVKEIGEY